MLNDGRRFRPTMRQAHGLGAIQAAGGGGSAPTTRYTMGQAQALGVLDTYTGGSGSTTCVYTTASNNAQMQKRAVSNALAEYLPGITGNDLRQNRAQVDASALTQADRGRIARRAAELFYDDAVARGGANAEIITAENVQSPPATYCVSS